MSHGGGGESVNPDMTPMLDMVFQLITFFMLVLNFKAASLDLELKLPVVGSARPVETGGASDLLILNINQKGQLKIFGEIKEDVEGYIATEAEASRMAARRRDRNFQDTDDLPTIVVVRADQATPFKLINRVIKACQDQGFRNFAMKAMNEAT
jgi:biopolymer transport protein ExbD